MDIKLFDSELKVMCVLWNEGDTTAKHISDVLKKEIGWNMNTTYTLIKRCIKKGAIERSEPNFMCHALIPKEEVQEYICYSARCLLLFTRFMKQMEFISYLSMASAFKCINLY